MGRFVSALAVGLLAALLPAAAQAPGEQAVRDCAATFGRALQSADAALLRPILPSRGKVRVRLVRLGPESGSFSASQVEALMQGFFRQGSIQSFEVLRIEHDPKGYALIRGRVELTDRDGRPGRVDLHLALQPEGERWVLREIRESPS